ncbi:transcriptional regulator Hpr [uncultured Clostridium sp.]|nr:transcriptional regulator Hpr [uncultured Clostridium sp.]
MLDVYSQQLNNLLVDSYRALQKVEEKMVKGTQSIDLSISEMHMLEITGKYGEEGCTISDLAQELQITLPSVTVAIKKLERKGYVQKIKSEQDARRVHVVPTRAGRRMNAVHRYFHEQMVRAFIREISEEEKPTLLKAMQNLNAFLEKNMDKMDGVANKGQGD